MSVASERVCLLSREWIHTDVSQFVIYSVYIHTPLRTGHLIEPKPMLVPCSQLSFLYKLSSPIFL